VPGGILLLFALPLNKEVKEFLSEVVNTLRSHTIDGEVTVLKNGHLKIKGRYPSGNYSFVMGSTPSDHRWKHCARKALRRFIYTEILQTEY
jgi:hypothetical protein